MVNIIGIREKTMDFDLVHGDRTSGKYYGIFMFQLLTLAGSAFVVDKKMQATVSVTIRLIKCRDLKIPSLLWIENMES